MQLVCLTFHLLAVVIWRCTVLTAMCKSNIDSPFYRRGVRLAGHTATRMAPICCSGIPQLLRPLPGPSPRLGAHKLALALQMELPQQRVGLCLFQLYSFLRSLHTSPTQELA